MIDHYTIRAGRVRGLVSERYLEGELPLPHARFELASLGEGLFVDHGLRVPRGPQHQIEGASPRHEGQNRVEYLTTPVWAWMPRAGFLPATSASADARI